MPRFEMGAGVGEARSEDAVKEQQKTTREQSKHAWYIAAAFALKDVLIELMKLCK